MADRKIENAVQARTLLSVRIYVVLRARARLDSIFALVAARTAFSNLRICPSRAAILWEPSPSPPPCAGSGMVMWPNSGATFRFQIYPDCAGQPVLRRLASWDSASSASICGSRCRSRIGVPEYIIRCAEEYALWTQAPRIIVPDKPGLARKLSASAFSFQPHRSIRIPSASPAGSVAAFRKNLGGMKTGMRENWPPIPPRIRALPGVAKSQEARSTGGSWRR